MFCVSNAVAIARPLGYLLLRQGIQWGDSNLALPDVARSESPPLRCLGTVIFKVHPLSKVHPFPLFQKAEAQLAYELQAAKEQQKIRLEEIEIEVVQRKKQITIEEKEIIRTDKELIAMVKRPAEAEAYKMQQLAEGQKYVETREREIVR